MFVHCLFVHGCNVLAPTQAFACQPSVIDAVMRMYCRFHCHVTLVKVIFGQFFLMSFELVKQFAIIVRRGNNIG